MHLQLRSSARTHARPAAAEVPKRDAPLALSLLAAALCLGVTAVHIVDQGGLPGSKTPGYVQGLYYALEIGGVMTAAALLASRGRNRWALALSVAIGPIVGYVLSRGPGLPNYTDDVGNWTEPLGVISLVVEGTLLVTAATALGWTVRRERAYRRHVTES
jgi:hypothetical protein